MLVKLCLGENKTLAIDIIPNEVLGHQPATL